MSRSGARKLVFLALLRLHSTPTDSADLRRHRAIRALPTRAGTHLITRQPLNMTSVTSAAVASGTAFGARARPQPRTQGRAACRVVPRAWGQLRGDLHGDADGGTWRSLFAASFLPPTENPPGVLDAR